MREIEFRAWDKTKEMYVMPHQVTTFDVNGKLCVDDHCILEQFTGLLDKEGNKIFEGDVIHLQWIHNYTGSIEFRNGTFCMVSAEKELIVRAIGELFSQNMSVIGNLHQHPHLLEQKK